MSTSYGGRALIGVCLTRAQIFKKETVKAFEHDRPSSMKFDPDTGKRLWKINESCILMPKDPDYVDGCDLSTVEPKKELGGLYLFNDSSGTGNEKRRYLLGDLAVEDEAEGYRQNNFKEIDGDDIRDTRESVRQILEPHGLWDPSKFGLWVVLYVSC